MDWNALFAQHAQLVSLLTAPVEVTKTQDYFLGDEWHNREVYLRNVGTKVAMDLAGGEGHNGNRISGYEFNGSNAQKWRLKKVKPGCAWSPWMLQNVHGGTYLDLAGGNQSSGAGIHAWEGVPDCENQHWYLITNDEEDPKSITIQSVLSSFNLGLWGGIFSNMGLLSVTARAPRREGSQWWEISE